MKLELNESINFTYRIMYIKKVNYFLYKIFDTQNSSIHLNLNLYRINSLKIFKSWFQFFNTSFVQNKLFFEKLFFKKYI